MELTQLVLYAVVILALLVVILAFISPALVLPMLRIVQRVLVALLRPIEKVAQKVKRKTD